MSQTLIQLQNLVKRDPEGYKDDFMRQLSHYKNLFEIVKMDPTVQNDQYLEMITFLAHVSTCFPDQLIEAKFVPDTISFIRQYYAQVTPSTRKSIVKCLQLIRSKSTTVPKKSKSKGIMEDPLPLLSLSFFLLKCRDKSLRESLKSYIVADIKAINSKGKNNKVNRVLQNFMYSMISQSTDAMKSIQQDKDLCQAIDSAIDSGDASDTAAKYSLDICIDLYRKQIWDDGKTVNIIADSLQSQYNKVLVTALKFFLGTDAQDESSDEEDDVPDVRKVKFRSTITKTSKGNNRKMEKALKIAKKKEFKTTKAEQFNFSALHLLNDPQGVTEKLFVLLTSGHVGSKEQAESMDENGVKTTKMSKDIKFELRVMIMNLISRLIGLHQLLVVNFYPWMVRFMKPQQPQITQILAILAQSVHSLIPPEYLQPLLKSIVNNFCIDSFSAEVIQVGLNTVREICSRNVHAMTQEILHYLCTFKSHKVKGVNMACRGLVSLFREIAPEMLPRKERGKVVQMEMSRGINKSVNQFGAYDAVDGIVGAELLDQELGSDDEQAYFSDASVAEEKPKNRLHLGLNLTADIPDASDQDSGSETGPDSDLELESDQGLDEDVISVEDHTEDLEPEEASVRTGRSTLSRVDSERIFTQEDFAKITELKLKREAFRMANGPKRQRSVSPSAETADANNVVSNSTIMGFQKRARSTKEDRVNSMKEGSKDRLKFGSRKGKHNIDKGSTTNKQKAKGKNFLMIVHKRSVAGKKRMSLRDKQKKLRKHIETQKKQY